MWLNEASVGVRPLVDMSTIVRGQRGAVHLFAVASPAVPPRRRTQNRGMRSATAQWNRNLPTMVVQGPDRRHGYTEHQKREISSMISHQPRRIGGRF